MHGVSDVVTFGAVPAKVNDEIIESIQARMCEGCVVLVPQTMKSGDTVKIQEGPMKGLLAVFERELTGTQRVALLLKTVSYSARLIVDRDWVSRIEKTKQA